MDRYGRYFGEGFMGMGQSLNVSLSFAVGLLDIYDKNGNKISSMKDYQ